MSFKSLVDRSRFRQNGPASHHGRKKLKEYARVEEVLAGFGVDLVLASDLSHKIGVSEMAKSLEKFQHTSAGPYVDLVPGKNGTGRCLRHADMQLGGTWLYGVWFLLTSVAPPSLYFDYRLTVLTDHE
jgi:hypothetical protein